MICQICKEKESSKEVSSVKICESCYLRMKNEVLLICTHCEAMAFIVKNPKNIERLKFFISATDTHFWASEVIVPMGGCPHCVSYERSVFGERREVDNVRKLQ